MKDWTANISLPQEVPLTKDVFPLLAPGDELRDPDGDMWRVTKIEYVGLSPRVTVERFVDFKGDEDWVKVKSI